VDVPATSISYHKLEQAIVRDLTNPRRLVPDYPCAGWSVLDIGCGIGQTLMAPELETAAERCGVDVDADAVAYGRTCGLDLKCAPAEDTGLSNARFDLVYSRVSLPYTGLHRSLPEIFRVLKPGGYAWMSLHPWTWELRAVGRAIRAGSVRDLIDRLYVLCNGLQFCLTGRCFKRPWSDTTESVQFSWGLRRALKRCGFVQIEMKRAEHYFLLTARKPNPVVAERGIGADAAPKHLRA
jgi:SAM-dependent methyltransferase